MKQRRIWPLLAVLVAIALAALAPFGMGDSQPETLAVQYTSVHETWYQPPPVDLYEVTLADGTVVCWTDCTPKPVFLSADGVQIRHVRIWPEPVRCITVKTWKEGD
ncbi:hypothetical protein HY374_01465 [Candidatus Berkelbacteria bacterium]|nr:hypothetical protein [Candidatus Berkelbacteria bacterium]